MQDLLPAVLATLRDSEDEVAMAVAPFLVSWVARLKANQKRTGGVPTVRMTHQVAMCARHVLKCYEPHLGQPKTPSSLCCTMLFTVTVSTQLP